MGPLCNLGSGRCCSLQYHGLGGAALRGSGLFVINGTADYVQTQPVCQLLGNLPDLQLLHTTTQSLHHDLLMKKINRLLCATRQKKKSEKNDQIKTIIN